MKNTFALTLLLAGASTGALAAQTARPASLKPVTLLQAIES